MKSLIIFIFIALSVSPGFTQTWQWASRFGGLSSDPQSNIPDESIKDMVVDDQGNVYFCGAIRSVANANGTPLATFGAYDIIVGKIDCHGNLVWVQTAGGLFDDFAYSIILHDNYLYFTGEISATINNPCNFFGNIITESTSDLFLAKMDTSGSLIWNEIGSPGLINLNSAANSLSVHGNDLNLLFRVGLNGGEIFPGEFVTRAWWLATLDTSGTILSKFEITPNIEAFRKFEHMPGPGGDHYFLGNFSTLDSVVIGGQTVHHINPTNSFSDILLFKFDSSGNLLWLEQIGDTLSRVPRGESLMVTANDELYVGGSIFNDFVFGNDTMFNTIGSNNRAFPFLAKYTNLGQAQWGIGMSTQFSSEVSGGISELPNGNIVYCGYFINSGQIASINLTGSGKEIFIAEVSPGGAFLSVEQLVCSGGTDHPESFTTDNSGNMFVGGGFAGTFTFNGTSYTSVGGATDAFVAKYGYMCTVGLDEEPPLSELSLNVYPNPVSDALHINLVTSVAEKIYIMNLLGELVMEHTPQNNTNTLSVPVRHLPVGIYLVQAVGKTGTASAKFVKME